MRKSTKTTDETRVEETATDEDEREQERESSTDGRSTEEETGRRARRKGWKTRQGREDREERAAREEQPEESERDAREGKRAVSFERATEALAEAFDIDRRRGETIADLETTETDQGRQLIATVERRRTTAVREKVRSAKRTGRRVGRTASVLGMLAAVAYGVRRARRFRRGTSGQDDEQTAGADISIDERAQ
ncbi:hypothetical protein [Halomarina litorea]|uniref:hypothetical protein n=1 Tax=Halomarina litorea TaxID=2961595 RepID=UPI0020C30A21|nr:hypothetical protein [Halomarina sp. BCD28]